MRQLAQISQQEQVLLLERELWKVLLRCKELVCSMQVDYIVKLYRYQFHLQTSLKTITIQSTFKTMLFKGGSNKMACIKTRQNKAIRIHYKVWTINRLENN